MIHRSALEKQIITEWADELSVKLDRAKDQILRDGLGASDFSSSDGLKLVFQDESFAQFQWAFFVTNPLRREVAVFTEHCGYHVFPLGGTTIHQVTVKQIWFDEEEE